MKIRTPAGIRGSTGILTARFGSKRVDYVDVEWYYGLVGAVVVELSDISFCDKHFPLHPIPKVEKANEKSREFGFHVRVVHTQESRS